LVPRNEVGAEPPTTGMYMGFRMKWSF